MPYVPGFNYDIFISYASEDNVDGWVEKFQKHLTEEVGRLVGRPFSDKSTFFDKIRLQAGQEYPNELDTAARETALLVALVSPNYSSSPWCFRERREFQKQLAPGASFSECLAAVRVRPTDALPATLENAQYSDLVIPGFQEPWPAGTGKWTEIVNKLSFQIAGILRKLRNRAGSIFLGHPLAHRMELRANLEDYLGKQHFRATPDPFSLLEDRAKSQQALAEAACAVHFIGGASSEALDCIQDSLDHCPGPTILFQPFGAEVKAAEDFFLDELPPERSPHRLGGNEVELKKFLEELLTRRRQIAVTSASLGLVCDLSDLGWARQFSAKDLSVDYPRFLQDKIPSADKLRRWRQLLKESHGLIFYQGNSAEPFLSRLERLAIEEKCTALRQWYLDGPDLDIKRANRPSDAVYSDGLDEFLDQVRKRARATGGAE
ncbi:MAG: toll/interleukin-1 receptor domain-containing protein [Bryobacteraceae bacterium]|nr:toll/interleukin-1 receptor domain-containing protein [Bryobacteraceae bacterium]